MSKIYIDTNILVGFYESTQDPIALIDELEAIADQLIVPMQTVSEFGRNRLNVLSRTISEFEKSTKFTPYCTSLIQHQQEFSQLCSKLDEAREFAKQIKRKLESFQDPNDDPYVRKIGMLFSRKGVQKIEISEAIFKAAQKRKLLGDPPFSSDKHTIGDEVIWESLLAHCEEDLIIVSRDNGFLNYQSILANEFKIAGKRKLIGVIRKLSEALPLIGRPSPPKLIEEEQRIEEKERDQQTITAIIRDNDQRPIESADVYLVAKNGTHLKGRSNQEGKVSFHDIKRRPVAVFCAHPSHRSFAQPAFDPIQDIHITLGNGDGGGSMISLGGWESLPGLEGKLSFIHDSSDRLYIYTKNISIDDQDLQPFKFQLGQILNCEDARGHTCSIVFADVIGSCFLIDYSAVQPV